MRRGGNNGGGHRGPREKCRYCGRSITTLDLRRGIARRMPDGPTGATWGRVEHLKPCEGVSLRELRRVAASASWAPLTPEDYSAMEAK